MLLSNRSITVKGARCGLEALLMAAITSLGGFLSGYDAGQVAGLLHFADAVERFSQFKGNKTSIQLGIRTDIGASNQTDTRAGSQANVQDPWKPIVKSLLVSFMAIGCLVGAFTADRLGRRRSLALGVVAYIIGGIIQMTAVDCWVQLMMGRFVAGLGVGSLSVGVPMFQSESSPKEIRGIVVVSYQLMITVGILVSSLDNLGLEKIEKSDVSWRIILAIGIICSLPLGLGILAIPESPRWLAGRGQWTEARMAIARFRGLEVDPHHKLVEQDVSDMREMLVKEHEVGIGTWLECFSSRPETSRILYRTLLGVAIHFLQQWTGVNFFFYYGQAIFDAAGMSNVTAAQVILAAVNFVMSFFGFYLVEKFGRRGPLFLGALWQAAWQLVFAVTGTATDPKNNKGSSIAIIVSACMFMASFTSTWSPMVWVVVGEMFTQRTRAKQGSLIVAASWLGHFLVACLTPLLGGEVNYPIGFVFFGTNLAAALLVLCFLYETHKLSLENVSLMYGEEELTPWSSSKWLPPGFVWRETTRPKVWDIGLGRSRGRAWQPGRRGKQTMARVVPVSLDKV